MKITLIVGAVTIVALSILYFMVQPQESSDIATPTSAQDTAAEGEQNRRIGNQTDTEQNEAAPAGKLKADTFTGTLQTVDTGCFADGECFVEVDGKHITVLMGWSQNTVGSVIGVEGFGDLEAFIGKKVEVYAQDNSDGTYTLYGSEGFYVKVLE